MQRKRGTEHIRFPEQHKVFHEMNINPELNITGVNFTRPRNPLRTDSDAIRIIKEQRMFTHNCVQLNQLRCSFNARVLVCSIDARKARQITGGVGVSFWQIFELHFIICAARSSEGNLIP